MPEQRKREAVTTDPRHEIIGQAVNVYLSEAASTSEIEPSSDGLIGPNGVDDC